MLGYRNAVIWKASLLDNIRKKHARQMLGHPFNLAYDFTGVFDTMHHNLNNGTHRGKLHTNEEEREVVTYFAALWNAHDAWGCMTGSGTDGNVQGLLLGREAFPRAVMYASEESHDSIPKIARMLRMRLRVVTTTPKGEMDYDALERAIDDTRPAVVCVNVGTAMLGATDDVRKVRDVMRRRGVEGYVHADAALMGAVLPYVAKADDDFAYDSMSVSGGFYGLPFPCGIFLAKRRHDVRCEPLSGSRSGHAPLFLQHVIEQKGDAGFRRDAETCMANARYLADELGNGAWMNERSVKVVFRQPCAELVDKWQLAARGGVAQAVVVPHVTRSRIDEFLHEYRAG